MEHAGLEVRTLKRVRIGGFRLPRTLGFGEVSCSICKSLGFECISLYVLWRLIFICFMLLQYLELRPNEVRRVLDRGADRAT
jgi:hypothetical protein